MGTNPFISHRMFVAALKGDGPAHDAAAPSELPESAHPMPPPAKLSAEQLAALAARQWLDFPFAPCVDQRAS